MPTAPRILIVEDEPAIADTLLYALKTEGFSPEWRTTGREALAAIAQEKFVLIVLDVGLPDGSGFEVCKAIRASSAVPVLFLSARNTELDRVLGLELGADDYVTKPFSPREITARVKAILRRGQELKPAALTGNGESKSKNASGFAHDRERCEVRLNGAGLALTRYEYRLLLALLTRPGRVFSRDELMNAAWEDPGASMDRTVDAHIKTLRAKLRVAEPDTEWIQTHRGMGYSLRAET